MKYFRQLHFVVGFVLGVVLIIAWNWYSFATMYAPYKICFDCGMAAGVPFTMYNSGYLWGGEGFIASGVFANACVALVSGTILGFLVSFAWRLVQSRFQINHLK